MASRRLLGTIVGNIPEGVFVQVEDAITELIETRGTSAGRVSVELGRSRSYVAGVAGRQGVALGTVADVADVLGYDLAVVDRETGETIGTLDAPRRRGDGVQGGAA